MKAFVNEIWQLFSAEGWLVIVAIVVAWRWHLVGEGLKDPKDEAFRNYRSQLAKDRFTGIYHRLLERWFLNPLARLIGDRQEQAACRPGGWLNRHIGIQPWTWQGYAFALWLAVLYPVLSLFLLWVFGADSRLGGIRLLEPTPWFVRGLLLGLPGLTCFAFWRAKRVSDWRSYAWFAAAFAAAFAFVVVGVDTSVHSGSGLLPIAMAIFVAAGGAGAFIADARGFARLAALGFGFSFGAVLLFGASAIAFGLSVVVPAAFIVTFWWVGKRSETNAIHLAVPFGYTVALLGLAFVLLSWWPPSSHGQLERLAMPAVFLGLLPILNAIWDWLSLGLTRGLLAAIRLGRHRGWVPLAWGVADVVFALAFMLGIIATITAALAFADHLLVTGGGSALIDLPVLFAGLRVDPSDTQFYWIYFMFFSTLIPTLIHLLIAGASLTQFLAHWDPLRRWRVAAAAQLDCHSGTRVKAQVYLTLVPLAGVFAPFLVLWGLYWLLTTHGGVIGYGLIGFAERVMLIAM